MHTKVAVQGDPAGDCRLTARHCRRSYSPPCCRFTRHRRYLAPRHLLPTRIQYISVLRGLLAKSTCHVWARLSTLWSMVVQRSLCIVVASRTSVVRSTGMDCTADCSGRQRQTVHSPGVGKWTQELGCRYQPWRPVTPFGSCAGDQCTPSKGRVLFVNVADVRAPPPFM